MKPKLPAKPSLSRSTVAPTLRQPHWHQGRKAAPLIYLGILVIFGTSINTSYADYSPKECYETIGNPKVDAPEQQHAFYLLQTQSGFEPYSSSADFSAYSEANYYLAECYVSGKTGEGGPNFARNRNGFPPNRPEAYKLAIPLYENAARHDHTQSLQKLSALYIDGKYLPENANKVLAFFLETMEPGDTVALEKLSSIYSAGFRGVTEDHQRLLAIETLANGGYSEAQIALSKHLLSEQSEEALARANKFLVPLAERGNASAIALLKEVAASREAARVASQRAAEEETSRTANARKQMLADEEKASQAAAADALQKANAERQRAADEQKAKQAADTQDTILTVVALAVLACLLLAIPGTILGLKEKLTVYNGYSDISTSCLVVVCSVLAFPDFGFPAWAVGPLKQLPSSSPSILSANPTPQPHYRKDHPGSPQQVRPPRVHCGMRLVCSRRNSCRP